MLWDVSSPKFGLLFNCKLPNLKILTVLGVHGVLYVIYNLCVIGVLALSVFDDGNMPAIQLIPREGLKSLHSYEGWIVVWSR